MESLRDFIWASRCRCDQMSLLKKSKKANVYCEKASKKDSDAYNSIRVYISSPEILDSMKLFVSIYLSQKYLIFSKLSFLNVSNKNFILKKFYISIFLSPSLFRSFSLFLFLKWSFYLRFRYMIYKFYS